MARACGAGQNYDKSGSRRLSARTRDPKAILVIGRRPDISKATEAPATPRYGATRSSNSGETRATSDIVTFDELLDRARFITRD